MNSQNDNKILNIPIPEQPKSNRAVKIGLIIVLIFFGGFGLWAFFVPLESAAITDGKIKVAGERRVIQHLEGGIVTKIHVKDGMQVKKGQLLIEVDDVQAKVGAIVRQNEVDELLAVEARLLAEANNQASLNFPDRLINGDNSKLKEIMRNQQRIFEANQDFIQNQKEIFSKRVDSLHEQISGLKKQNHSLSLQLEYIKDELKDKQYLASKNLIEKPKVLALQREAAGLNGKIGENISTMAALDQKIGETKLQISGLEKDFQKETLKELRETQQKLAEAIEKEKSAEDILKHTKITSPVKGTIVGLKVFTIGAVLKPGETIMEIVPSDEELIVETQVKPVDIDVVHKGLTAKVNLVAFKSRYTPYLLGKVTYVSADALIDEKTGQPYFLAEIYIPPEELKRLKPGEVLYPGMPVQALIITGRSTPWQYFTIPIFQSFDRAFRED